MEYKERYFFYSWQLVEFLNENKIEKENIIVIFCGNNGVIHLIYRG